MKRLISLFLIICLLSGLSACSMVNPKKAVSAAELIVAPKYPDGISFDNYEAMRAKRNSNPISQSGNDAMNAFSYNTAAPFLSAVSVNSCYSPLSLYFALALVGTGANGRTRDELLTLLGASDSDKLSQDMSNLYRVLFTNNKVTQLKIANSLWLDHEYRGEAVKYKDAFTQNAAERFYASLFKVDFAQPSAGEAMAKWIADNTNGTLKPKFDPDPEQILSIINTIYFKDEWVDRFRTDQTKPDIFHLADGKDVTCDFMNTVFISHGFSKGDGFTRSALNLKSNGQMVFILPDKGVSMQDLVSSPEKLKALFEGGKGTNGKVTWKVPKFSYDSTFKLVDMLKTLGVTSAFEEKADFTGITDHQAFVSSVTQQTHIAIDENGVVASAFTKVDYAGAAMPVDQADMILDRPFIYGIFSVPAPVSKDVDRPEQVGSSGKLLFVGICGNPVS